MRLQIRGAALLCCLLTACAAGGAGEAEFVDDCRLESQACAAGSVCAEAFEGFVCVERNPEAPDDPGVLVDAAPGDEPEAVDPEAERRARCDQAAQNFIDCLVPVCGVFATHEDVSNHFCSLPEDEAPLEYYAHALCFDLRAESCGQEGWECACPEEVPEEHADEGDFRVAWDPPGDPLSEEFETYLQDSGVVDAWVRWLNRTFKLPYSIQIQHENCGVANAYYHRRKVRMCYEYLALLAEYWYGTNYTPEQASEAALGVWKSILLHEVGHALVDAYELPVTGQEEDAVDEFAALTLIELEESRNVVYSAYFKRSRQPDDPSLRAYADEHSFGLQRAYNMLCSVYGSDPDGNDWILERFPEMEDRAPRCPYEFRQKRAAWDSLLGPWLQEKLRCGLGGSSRLWGHKAPTSRVLGSELCTGSFPEPPHWLGPVWGRGASEPGLGPVQNLSIGRGQSRTSSHPRPCTQHAVPIQAPWGWGPCAPTAWNYLPADNEVPRLEKGATETACDRQLLKTPGGTHASQSKSQLPGLLWLPAHRRHGTAQAAAWRANWPFRRSVRGWSDGPLAMGCLGRTIPVAGATGLCPRTRPCARSGVAASPVGSPV